MHDLHVFKVDKPQSIATMINDYLRPELWAVRPDGRGEVTSSHVAWKHSRTMPSRPSPLLVDDLLFVVSSEGVATCLEAKTGEVVWQERVGGKFSASPILAGGRIYLFDESSVTTVIEPGRKFQTLAVNKLTPLLTRISGGVVARASDRGGMSRGWVCLTPPGLPRLVQRLLR